MAADRIQELYEQKKGLVAEIRALADREANWDAGDAESWEKRNEELDTCQADIDRIEQTLKVDARINELQEEDQQRQHSRKTEIGQHRSNRLRTNITDEQRALAFSGMVLRDANREPTGRMQEAMHVMGLSNSRREFSINLGTGGTRGLDVWGANDGRGRTWGNFSERYNDEFRGPLDTLTPGAGAEWVPSETFRAELIKTMIAFGGLRGVCRVISTTGGEPYRFPTVDDTANLAEDLTESTTASPQEVTAVDPTTGDVTWYAFKKGSLIKWSIEEQQDSPLSIMSIVAQLLGERIGRKFAPLYTTGVGGTSSPQGITVGATDSGATWSLAGTGFDNGDSLIAAQTALDPAYETGNVGWVLHKTTLGEIRKLKTTDNYLWQPGLRFGEPDLLLNDRYVVDNSMPLPELGNRAIVYGDLSRYIIRDVATMRSQFLGELFALTDQVGMTAYMRSDGRVSLPAALLYVEVAA